MVEMICCATNYFFAYYGGVDAFGIKQDPCGSDVS